jgi:hypothetical protein
VILAPLLLQLAGIIERIDDAQYLAERAKGVSGGVGSHVRHCLDHVCALLAGLPAGRVDYDRRQRGTAIEVSRPAALAEIQRLVPALTAAGRLDFDRPLEIVITQAAAAAAITASSSLGREFAFVESHTIHHFAIIALLLRELGVEVPSRFGYAPSTPTAANAA